MSLVQARHDEPRRGARKRANATVDVIDSITKRPFGHLCDLSRDGMMLVSRRPPRANAIYQLRLVLAGAGIPVRPIEAGVQERWQRCGADQHHVWAGYRIIAISDKDARLLDAWLSLPEP